MPRDARGVRLAACGSMESTSLGAALCAALSPDASARAAGEQALRHAAATDDSFCAAVEKGSDAAGGGSSPPARHSRGGGMAENYRKCK